MATVEQLQQASVSLDRLWPRLEARFRDQAEPVDWQVFEQRLRREWPRLFELLIGLYGGNYDFFYYLEEILSATARSWLARPIWLKELDAQRTATILRARERLRQGFGDAEFQRFEGLLTQDAGKTITVVAKTS